MFLRFNIINHRLLVVDIFNIVTEFAKDILRQKRDIHKHPALVFIQFHRFMRLQDFQNLDLVVFCHSFNVVFNINQKLIGDLNLGHVVCINRPKRVVFISFPLRKPRFPYDPSFLYLFISFCLFLYPFVSLSISAKVSTASYSNWFFSKII